MKHLLLTASLAAMTAFSAMPAQAQLRLPGFISSSSSEGMVVDERGVLTMAPLLERTTPAVVNIAVTTTVRGRSQSNPLLDDPFFRRFFDPDGEGDTAPSPRERQATSAGSGVIIDARKGYVLSNHHVIEDADEVNITLKDGRVVTAQVLGSDSKTDIALLQIESSNLTALSLANSDDTKVGDYVIAIGNPFGLGQTVTSGIVSALGRGGISADGYEDFIQTDASINPGNSGGALINTKGELIGINTAIISRSGSSAGVGFAVPANIASKVVDQLSKYGEVRRGRIGVIIQDLTADLSDALDLSVSKGALVSQVQEDSPAEEAGLKSGDIIIAFNGESVEGSRDIRNAVGFVERGTRNDITYIRDGRRNTVKINVEEAPAEDEEDGSAPSDASNDNFSSTREGFRGASLSDFPDDVEISGGNEGVYIQDVENGSKAYDAGLRGGDVIRAVNRKDVADLEAFQNIIDDNNGVLALTVQRGRSQLFVAIK